MSLKSIINDKAKALVGVVTDAAESINAGAVTEVAKNGVKRTGDFFIKAREITQNASTEAAKDKIRSIGDWATTSLGAVTGFMAAGFAATAAGVTSITGLTSFASLFGVTVVSATPIGWVIGATVAGGSLAYGLSRLIKNGAHAEGQLSELRASKRHQEHLQQREVNAGSLLQTEIEAFQALLEDVVNLNGITNEFAEQVSSLVINGDMTVDDAMQTLNDIRTTIIIKEEVTQSASEYNALLWILDSQVKQGILLGDQAAELVALVNSNTITEAQALKSLESYLSNFGIFYLLAPIMFKLALLDGVFHPAEKDAIRDYFVKEMGYQSSQVDRSINELLVTIEKVSMDDLISSLSLYIDEHHDSATSANLKEGILVVLEQVVAADGKVDDQEEVQLTRIRNMFSLNQRT